MARCLWCTEELEESSMVFCSRSCEEALCHAMVIYVAWKRKTRITSKPIITDNAGYIAGSAHCATTGQVAHPGGGQADFDTLRRLRDFEKWALDRGLSKEQRELVFMVCDFKRANPEIKPEQLLRSQRLQHTGGLARIKRLFGSLNSLIGLADQALEMEVGTGVEGGNEYGNDT